MGHCRLISKNLIILFNRIWSCYIFGISVNFVIFVILVNFDISDHTWFSVLGRISIGFHSFWRFRVVCSQLGRLRSHRDGVIRSYNKRKTAVQEHRLSYLLKEHLKSLPLSVYMIILGCLLMSQGWVNHIKKWIGSRLIWRTLFGSQIINR